MTTIDELRHKTNSMKFSPQSEKFPVNSKASDKIKILPPLLNRYTQDNNVHIWARGPAKPPSRLFNIYADMYKYPVLSINERTEAPKPDTKTPKNQQVYKKHGERVPPTKAVVQPLEF